MYLTAHRVWSRSVQREAIHTFYYQHPQPLPGPISVAYVADRNPGELVSSAVELPSGGNEVRSYLDLVASDDVAIEALRSSLREYSEDANASGQQWIAGRVVVRFYAGPSICDHGREFFDLRDAILELYQAGRPSSPLVVRVAEREHSVRYSLDEASLLRLRKLRGPDWVMSPSIVIDRDTLHDLEQAHGNVEEHILPALTGLDSIQVSSIGGVRFVTDSGLVPIPPSRKVAP